MKLYVNMPVGEGYGWAICGKNTIKALSRLTDVGYIADEKYKNAIRDQLTDSFINNITESPNGEEFNYLCAIDNDDGKLTYRGSKNIGYMFYENDIIHDSLLNNLMEYDLIATGSHWNTAIVRGHGMNAETVHQGINLELFKPKERKLFKDKFVIFSGGKLEQRKGQDVVAYAVSILQKKYKDIILVASWDNIFFDDNLNKQNTEIVKSQLLPEQTVFLELCNQQDIVQHIADSDIGFFPNRCEGGTNLVMMEYMACGKPVVAHNATGQKDVLNENYAFLAEGSQDDQIDKYLNDIEYAYLNRDKLITMGVKAREAMESFTWEKTAREFLKLYENDTSTS